MKRGRLSELAIHVEEPIYDGARDCGDRLRWTLAMVRREALEDAARLCAAKAEEIKHTRHVDGIGMGWIAGETLALQLDSAIRGLVEDAAPAAKEAVPSIHEPIAREAQ